jgi:hypothetical protein
MFSFITQIADFLAPGRAAESDVAHDLMESAEARAGTNAHQAEELRQNARAYLSVVR